jgi:alkylation response protein AidB-like acyl-CoA dehydrogenase
MIRGCHPYFVPTKAWTTPDLVDLMDAAATRENGTRLSGRREQTTQIYEGTNQIQRIVVARGLLDRIIGHSGPV